MGPYMKSRVSSQSVIGCGARAQEPNPQRAENASRYFSVTAVSRNAAISAQAQEYTATGFVALFA